MNKAYITRHTTTEKVVVLAIGIKKANYGDKVIRNKPTKSKPLKEIERIVKELKGLK
jgi:hypothetical protein